MSAQATALCAALLAAVVAAGCTAPGGLNAEAKVSFNGSGSGEDSDKADCDKQGTLQGNGAVEDGTLHVEVKDGDGETVYENDFDGEIDLASELDGAAGDWTLSAERSGDDLVGDEFRGDYDLFLNCKGV